ncbi:MAG: hypothetical protein IJ284_02295 [Clostridia bacterium]|nr:hypothetical protein [Clostridia bacterium]
MYLKLRVFFTILAALCLGFALTAGAIWGYIWAIVLGLGALLFFMLMLIFKQAQEKEDAKNNPSEPSFLNPKQKNEDPLEENPSNETKEE